MPLFTVQKIPFGFQEITLVQMRRLIIVVGFRTSIIDERRGEITSSRQKTSFAHQMKYIAIDGFVMKWLKISIIERIASVVTYVYQKTIVRAKVYR
jgi:hypothetical protein